MKVGRKLLEQILKDREISMAELSRQIDRSSSYIQKYLHMNSPRRLPDDVRDRIATNFGFHTDALREPDDPRARYALADEKDAKTIAYDPLLLQQVMEAVLAFRPKQKNIVLSPAQLAGLITIFYTRAFYDRAAGKPVKSILPKPRDIDVLLDYEKMMKG